MVKILTFTLCTLINVHSATSAMHIACIIKNRTGGEVNITLKERIAGGNQCPIEEKTQLSSMIFGETRIIPHRGSLTDGNSYFQLTVEAADGTKPNTNFSTSRDYYAEIEICDCYHYKVTSMYV